MRVRITWIVLMSILCSAMAAAQGPSMEPPAELKKLDWMLGEWISTTKWVMQGMEGEMTGTMKTEWDGQFLKTTSTMEMTGMKMVETQYIGWDAKSKKYVSHTFTNFAPTARVERGDYDGGKFVSVSDPWEVDGMAMIGRATITPTNSNEGKFLLEFKIGDAWTKAAEGTYKRKPK